MIAPLSGKLSCDGEMSFRNSSLILIVYETVKVKHIPPMCLYLFINYMLLYTSFILYVILIISSLIFILMIKNKIEGLIFSILSIDCFAHPTWGTA